MIRPNQMYISIYEIEKSSQENKNRKLNMGGTDEREMEEAMQRSLKDYNDQQQKLKEENGEDAPGVGTVLNKKEDNFIAFQGQGISLGGGMEQAPIS
mmetsp:Transcript_4604/g.4325  ORF Transcript_4604/g.4325 Transcript_4604/m.4325 type:complete len:97 (+) Transcript_4604:235-525(+)